jgi:hypothetical protein
MAKPPPPATPGMTLDRVRHLLDAYGARSAAWPEGERAAAQALIDGSPAARALWLAAREVDDLLGVVEVVAPPALAARVLAAAPRRRRHRALIAALPLAAAALLALWIAARAPSRSAPDVAALVGVYFTPTDVLLQLFTLDGAAPLPAVDGFERDAPRSSDENGHGGLG